MGKPGIFFGLKRHCAKKEKTKKTQNKRVWIEWLPAPEPILHRCIELPLKSLTKGKYPLHGHLRKDESHDQLWGGGLLGAYVFKSSRRGGSFSLSWDATKSCLSWLSPTSSLDIIHVMNQLPNITIPPPSQWKCVSDAKQGALFKQLFYFAWHFQWHTYVLMKFNFTLKAVSSNGAEAIFILHFVLTFECKLYK